MSGRMLGDLLQRGRGEDPPEIRNRAATTPSEEGLQRGRGEDPPEM